jgi:hypothetical protein
MIATLGTVTPALADVGLRPDDKRLIYIVVLCNSIGNPLSG